MTVQETCTKTYRLHLQLCTFVLNALNENTELFFPFSCTLTVEKNLIEINELIQQVCDVYKHSSTHSKWLRRTEPRAMWGRQLMKTGNSLYTKYHVF